MAHAGQEERAPRRARARLGDADPARAAVVVAAAAVPVEAHLDAAVLVGVDLLAGRADDDGRLDPVEDGPRRPARRPEGHVRGHHLEVAAVPVERCAPLGPAVLDPRDQVAAVQLGARVLGQHEGAPRGEARRVALPPAGPARRLQLLEPELRKGAAGLGHRVVPGVLEDLEGGGLTVGDAGGGRRPGEPEHGPLEVVVGDDDPRRAHLLGEVEAGHVLPGRERAAVGPVRDPVVPAGRGGDGGVLRRHVRDHERVGGLVVLEEVVDALLLHQPVDEVPVALAVLHAVLAGAVGPGEPRLVAARGLCAPRLAAKGDAHEAGALEDVGEDLRHRAPLEDAAVGAEAHARHGRHQGDHVLAARPASVAVHEAAHHAVDQARLGQRVAGVDCQDGRAADDLARREVVLLAAEGDLEPVRLRERLVPGEANDAQRVLQTVDGEGVHGLSGSLAANSRTGVRS